jgi:hypothetical protein
MTMCAKEDAMKTAAPRCTDARLPRHVRFRRGIAAFPAFLVAVLLITGAGAQTQAASATTVSEVECGILLPGILPEGQVLSTTGQLVITAAGTATLTCRGRLDPALAPDSTLIITDIPCALGDGGTVGESHTQVSPSGQVLLVCQNNPGSEPLPPPDGD